MKRKEKDMKKMKRLFAVLLAMAMVLGLSMTAFAEKQNSDLIPREVEEYILSHHLYQEVSE